MKMLSQCFTVLISIIFLSACQSDDNELTLSLEIEVDQELPPVVDIPSGNQTDILNCGETPSGEFEQRVMYESNVTSEGVCKSETQVRVCTNGEFGGWSGNYNFLNCELLSTPGLYNKISFDSLEYQGGFRLSSQQFGDSGLSYAAGVIELNPENNSLFITSSRQAILEIEIPEIVNSRDMADFNVGGNSIQDFVSFYDTERVNTGIDEYFTITGMELIQDQLVVNYYSHYDASGAETDTSIVFSEADDLAQSNINGPFQMQGAAHAGGWLTPIPAEYQDILGGTYISGWSAGSIISRLSIGPSAFVQSPEDNLLINPSGEVETTAVLDFSLFSNKLLYDTSDYPNGVESTDEVLYNQSLNNDLWTMTSSAKYGFIVPGTDTYLTVGFSSGHEFGLDYKITQDEGKQCGGPCSFKAEDEYNYYWMWSVQDLIKVKKGEVQPHEVRPYEYGKLGTPSKAPIAGGSFDYENNLLYLSLANGDSLDEYARPPIFYVYKINVD